MKTLIRILFFITICFSSIISCDKKKTSFQDKKTKTSYATENKNIDILQISYEETVRFLGKPLYTEEFENAKKGEVFPGIRAAIGKYYPSGEKIIIKEAIWKKNDSTEIAIWYTRKQDKWMPFGHFEYDKNTDF